MLDHNLYDRTEEIVDYLVDHKEADINGAIYYVYGQHEKLPEEYILNIQQEICQCSNCGEWKVPKDILDGACKRKLK